MIYDAGTVFGRGQRPTRRHLDERVMRRELEVIRDELHATHVRVVASDPARLDTVAAAVAEAGLGLWYSPAVFDYDPAETARRTVAMAGHAEALRRRLGGQVTFVAGSEATLFVRGLVPGKRLTDRFARIKADPSLLHSGDLARYLTTLAAELRPVFGGPSPTRRCRSSSPTGGPSTSSASITTETTGLRTAIWRCWDRISPPASRWW